VPQRGRLAAFWALVSEEPHMIRCLNCVVLLIALAAAVGCSRDGEKDKNYNKDRPKPAEPAKEK
jgi:hypothetical protein